MELTLPEYPVIDGFSYNTRLRPTLQNAAMAYRQFDALRRSGAYRSRWLTIPEDTTTPIPAGNEYQLSCFCSPGSAFWGWTFVAEDPSTFAIQITDHATKVTLWDKDVAMDLSAGVIASGQGKDNVFQRLLIMAKPGAIDVSIYSTSSVDTTGVQLIIKGGEPVPEDECDPILIT